MIKNPPPNCRRLKRCWFDPWVRKIPGGGHRNRLQYSCLENSMDRGAWWASVSGGHKESDMTEHAHTHNALLILYNPSSLQTLPSLTVCRVNISTRLTLGL